MYTSAELYNYYRNTASLWNSLPQNATDKELAKILERYIRKDCGFNTLLSLAKNRDSENRFVHDLLELWIDSMDFLATARMINRYIRRERQNLLDGYNVLPNDTIFNWKKPNSPELRDEHKYNEVNLYHLIDGEYHRISFTTSINYVDLHTDKGHVALPNQLFYGFNLDAEDL